MKETGVIFQDWGVRAILDDLKTMTRRISGKGIKEINEAPNRWRLAGESNGDFQFFRDDEECRFINCPYGVPGEKLWVKEKHWIVELENAGVGVPFLVFDDDFNGPMPEPEMKRPWKGAFNRWGCRPSIFMPRWASRIDLKVVGVKVERVQDISEEDAKAEGVDGGCVNCGNDSLRNPCGCASPEPLYRDSFIYLWNSINAKPKPVKADGIVHHYVSYPWEDVQETCEHRGKPWLVMGNPWVFATSFKRIKP